MRTTVSIVLTALLLSLFPNAGSAQEIAIENDVNFVGGDYQKLVPKTKEAKECGAACANTKQCNAFTFVRPSAAYPNGLCILKSEIKKRVADKCCISGALRAAQDSASTPPTLSTTRQRDIEAPPRAAATIIWSGSQGAQPIVVSRGDTVLWVMGDELMHTITHRANDGRPLFDSGYLQGNGRWFAFGFDQPGRYVVYDKVQPNLTGLVEVR